MGGEAMSNCGNVNERLDSIIKAIEGLKNQVPATDWTQANTLRLVGELANICRELASTGTGETLQFGQRIVKDRKGELDKLRPVRPISAREQFDRAVAAAQCGCADALQRLPELAMQMMAESRKLG
jgi:hypothetical protein